jgi:small-conductance mechanosensitive channel
VASSTHLLGHFSILLWPVILLVILDLFVLNGLDSDRERQVLGVCFFIIGYLIANQPEVWQAVKNLRGYSLVLAFISFGLVIRLVIRSLVIRISKPRRLASKRLFKLTASEFIYHIFYFVVLFVGKTFL